MIRIVRNFNGTMTNNDKLNDRLSFYSKSRDSKAGKGANEYVENGMLYENLNKIKDWRKVLSNFHYYPFVYEGHTYNTIEHVFQAKKIELADKEKALWFTVESGNEIGQGDGEIARKNRKLVKLDNALLVEWGKIKDQIIKDAAVQKYLVCEEARNVLIETKEAQLWHIMPRAKPIRFTHLEEIRVTL